MANAQANPSPAGVKRPRLAVATDDPQRAGENVNVKPPDCRLVERQFGKAAPENKNDK